MSNKEGGFFPIIIVMFLSIAIAAYWDKIPIIKDSVHRILDPSAGALLNWHLEVGMLIIILAISLLTIIIKKYTTDQKALRELREEQKILQKEMEKFREHPEKIAELSKKQMEFIPRTFKLTSRSVLFTGIPFILFFRWFYDTFTTMGNPSFFGFMNWYWFYFIFVMIFSGLLGKYMKII